MRLESRIVHGLDRAVRLEVTRDGHRVRAMRSNSPRQSADAPQQQPAIEWRRNGTAHTLCEPHPLDEIAVALRDDGAAEQIAVPAEVLGGGVHHQVGAEPERTLKHRYRPRVVYHAGRATGMCQGGEVRA